MSYEVIARLDATREKEEINKLIKDYFNESYVHTSTAIDFLLDSASSREELNLRCNIIHSVITLAAKCNYPTIKMLEQGVGYRQIETWIKLGIYILINLDNRKALWEEFKKYVEFLMDGANFNGRFTELTEENCINRILVLIEHFNIQIDMDRTRKVIAYHISELADAGKLEAKRLIPLILSDVFYMPDFDLKVWAKTGDQHFHLKYRGGQTLLTSYEFIKSAVSEDSDCELEITFLNEYRQISGALPQMSYKECMALVIEM